KGKIWTGLIGIFVPFLLLFGAIRVGRPHSPWARWRYVPGKRRGEAKMARARKRERRHRQPLIRAKIWVQDLFAGRPSLPDLPHLPPGDGGAATGNDLQAAAAEDIQAVAPEADRALDGRTPQTPRAGPEDAEVGPEGRGVRT